VRLSLFAVTIMSGPVNPFANPNIFSSHTKSRNNIWLSLLKNKGAEREIRMSVDGTSPVRVLPRLQGLHLMLLKLFLCSHFKNAVCCCDGNMANSSSQPMLMFATRNG
jgi:hypothetical protein